MINWIKNLFNKEEQPAMQLPTLSPNPEVKEFALNGGVPKHIRKEVLKQLPNEFIEAMQKFYKKFVER